MIEGIVGGTQVVFITLPSGASGQVEVKRPDGAIEWVRWMRDDQGLWIETPRGYSGYDIRKNEHEDGTFDYQLLGRKQARVLSGVSFLKSGEQNDATQGGKLKKAVKVKSQMPGKIVRILVRPGQEVRKGEPLLVMEAMKMENEIKSLQDGVIRDVRVTEGQAIETGAELLVFV